MDVLMFAITLGLLAFALALAFACLRVAAGVIVAAGFIFYLVWPLAVGLVIGITMWRHGQDNLGMVVILCGLAVQVWMWMRVPDAPSNDPMADKKRVYDIKGRIKGYIDRI